MRSEEKIHVVDLVTSEICEISTKNQWVKVRRFHKRNGTTPGNILFYVAGTSEILTKSEALKRLS